jgi:F-type H+-transporting ATPase subunit b
VLATLNNVLLFAAETGAEEEEGGNFLVSPGLGLMIWTLIAFGATLLILRKAAFPRIQAAIDRRRVAIEESIKSAQQTKEEADKLLTEYRARLVEAREQADDIIARSRKAAEAFEEEQKSSSRKEREEMIDATRREIEAEKERALVEIRKEVANLTVLATEKVAGKALDSDDHRRLIEEALAEVDFSALAGGNGGKS